MSVEDICKIGESDWRVVGVDPAPKKSSTICFYDGESLGFAALKAHKLLKLMKDLKSKEDVLITWDAPLTGPPILEHGDEEHAECYFYFRWIEHFLRTNGTYKPPTGISTLGYAGCPHWAITKAATGLPILGPYCASSDDLPFHHVVSEKDKLCDKKANIIEVHPATAIYLGIYSSKEHNEINDWRYKQYRGIQKELFNKLMSTFFEDLQIKPCVDQIKSDDHLDAFVAWALGHLYVTQSENQPVVRIMGNWKTGSMLLPWDKDLFSGFDAFFESNDVASLIG